MTQQEKLSKCNRKNLNNHKINELHDNMKQSNKMYNWNARKKGQNRKYFRKNGQNFFSSDENCTSRDPGISVSLKYKHEEKHIKTCYNQITKNH